MSAKIRGRVLSNGLEMLFLELSSMTNVSNETIVDRAKDYFKAQLSKSLELALDIPSDPYLDIDLEIAGTEQLVTKMRDALKHQQFSASVQSDAQALLNASNPAAVKMRSDAFQIACNSVLRAKMESTRILAAMLRGDFHEAAPKDALFAGVTTFDLPPIPGDFPKDQPREPRLRVGRKKVL
jgi:hypothetical protein